MDKIYDPKTAQKEISEAKRQLFYRIIAVVSVWLTIVVLFAVLVTLP